MRDVDIHTHSLTVDLDRLTQLQQLLSPGEDARRKAFIFPKDQGHFAAGRGMLREILARYLAADPRELEFEYGPHGKPSLRGVGIHFNVSHSAGVAIYAVSRSREVGVDIERINLRSAEEQIARRFFSPGEAEALLALPAHLRLESFFRCWTRKEAYIKACGLGLSMPLDSFDVTLGPGEPAAFLRGGEDWSIEGLETVPGYAAAVVAKD